MKLWRKAIPSRIECGPARKTGTATTDLLDNRHTAAHYRIGGLDATGERITLGQEMAYLDYYGPRVWYVYHFINGRWIPVHTENTEKAAREWAAKQKE